MIRSFKYEPKVERIRSLIEHLEEYDDEERILEKIADLFNLNLSNPLNIEARNNIFEGFVSDQSREITPSLALSYANRLFRDFAECRDLADLFSSVAPMLRKEAEVLTPIFIAFWDFVLRSCEKNDIKHVRVAATDANPIYIVGKASRRDKCRSLKSLELIDIGRSVLNIQDEIEYGHDRDTPEKYKFGSTIEQLAKTNEGRYLEILRSNPEMVFVDGEAYGSIIRILLKLGWKIQVHLLASNNPFLHGFLNKVVEYQLLSGTEISPDIIWKIGDNLEAIPRPYKIQNLTIEGSSYILHPYSLTDIYASMGLFNYWFFSKEALKRKNDSLDIIEAVRTVNRECCNCSGLLLPNAMPEWSRAGEFLRLWIEEGLGFVEPQIEYIPNSKLRD